MRRHAFAEVADTQGDAAVGTRDLDLGAIGLGVAVNVGEGFLNDAEQSDLDRAGEAAEVVGEIHLNVHTAASSKALDVPLDGGRESGFVEQGRVEQVRDGAGFAAGLVNELDSFGEGGVSGDGLAGDGEVHFYGSQVLADAVVEFARETAAFFILKAEEASSEGTERALGVFAGAEFGVEQTGVQVEECKATQECEREHEDSKKEQATRAVEALFEELLLLGGHVFHHVIVGGEGGDEIAIQGMLLFGGELAGTLQGDGFVHDLDATANDGFEIAGVGLLGRVVAGETLHGLDVLQNLAGSGMVGLQVLWVAGSEVGGAELGSASGSEGDFGEGLLDVAGVADPVLAGAEADERSRGKDGRQQQQDDCCHEDKPGSFLGIHVARASPADRCPWPVVRKSSREQRGGVAVVVRMRAGFMLHSQVYALEGGSGAASPLTSVEGTPKIPTILREQGS